MELSKAIRERRSIRCFLPGPIPEKVIKEIISEALWAPSWGNTQPFELVLAKGPALEAFAKENSREFLSGATPRPDVPMPQTWPDNCSIRYKEVGRSVLTSLSIDRKDQAGRMRYYETMFSIFHAPAFLLITLDKEISLEYAMLDIGLFVQTFCLSAYGKGIGTCAMAASVYYPEIIRKHFLIPENKRIVVGIAIGHPDMNSPVNSFERKRATIEEIVKWV